MFGLNRRYGMMKQFLKQLGVKKSTVKMVRVDDRTVIEVDSSIPDKTARREFLLKLAENERKQHQYHGNNYPRRVIGCRPLDDE